MKFVTSVQNYMNAEVLVSQLWIEIENSKNKMFYNKRVRPIIE